MATSGRPGPVVVDSPKVGQGATAEYTRPAEIRHESYRPQVEAPAADVEKALEMLANAQRPILYTGGGVINSGPEASRLLRELTELTGAPVTSTLMSLGALPASSPQWLGMLGMHGTHKDNMAMIRHHLNRFHGPRHDERVNDRRSCTQNFDGPLRFPCFLAVMAGNAGHAWHV